MSEPVTAARPPGGGVTFLGHATVLLELGAAQILTDPVLTHRVAFIRRVGGAAVSEALAPSLVLISHGHQDHLHRASMKSLAPDIPVVVPTGLGRLVGGWGLRQVHEVAVGQTLIVAETRITALRADHSGFRPPSGPRADAIGFLVEAAGRRVYFAGDTDLYPEMAELAEPTLDLALLPVWGWGPRLGPGHLDPARAALAAQRVAARYVIPIHWGTLWPIAMRWRRHLLFEPPQRFAEAVAGLGLPTRVVILSPGGRFELPPAPLDQTGR